MMMNEAEYRWFLKETADRIMNLTAENKPECSSRFHTYSNTFWKQQEAYWEAFEQAKKEAESDSDLKNYNEGNPPRDCLEWFADPHNRDWRFWTVPLPFCPDDWIQYYYSWNPLGLYDRPKEPNEDERLMCEYVILGLIYDQVLEVVICDRLCKIDNEEWRSCTWDALQTVGVSVHNDSEKTKRRINSAIDHVKSDLKKYDQTDQNVITKRQRIWLSIKGFVKEAYRITIKSFFDSAMNK